jgi:hypothetical protein
VSYDARLSVSAGLDHLAERLDPIITARFPVDLGGHPWTVVLKQLDEIAGWPPKPYTTTDLQAQLQVLTRRLGDMGYPFDDAKQTLGALGRELKIVRNARAHGDPFTRLDAWRAHDFCVRLLEYFEDAEGLVRANELRQEALVAYIEHEGIAPVPAATVTTRLEANLGEDQAEPAVQPEDEPAIVTPDPVVFIRRPSKTPSSLGNSRLAFEPWEPVLVGDVEILDALPKKAAKDKVRSVAMEIVDFEGPIHVDRLAQLVAASFGVQRLWPARAKKIVYQIKQTGLTIDGAKFVWPEGVDPESWREFRPNSSENDRPFLYVSPVEIANAMRFLRDTSPGMSSSELDAATLRTFGRRRRTKQLSAHLTKARSLVAPSST